MTGRDEKPRGTLLSLPDGTTRIIGITGGIASGKSTLAKMFQDLGFPCFNADVAVHQLLQQNAAVIAAIAAAFPASSDGKTVDRSVLAATITHHPEKLAVLEAILHPPVRECEEFFIAAARAQHVAAAVLDIPLLFETDAHTLCDYVIVADAPLAVRKARAFLRDGMSEEKWQRLLARQLPDHAAHPRADIVINTDTSEEETRAVVQALMKQWMLS